MLEVKHISKHYGKHSALQEIDLNVAAGQVFGLLGPNGAGKTTLLRILATLLQPSAGTATVAGYDIHSQPEQVRHNIGVVNGGMGLYDRLTGREILHYFGMFYGMAKDAIDSRIDELDAMLDLKSTLGRRASEYSTGMKQKIVIARAVLHNPKVLILDEAASGLDIIARRGLLDFVKTYRAPERLVLYSTHVMSEVEDVCDALAIIDQGKLLFCGTQQALQQQTGERTLERSFFNLVSGLNHAL